MPSWGAVLKEAQIHEVVAYPDVGVGAERYREIVRRCKVTREFISREFISMDES